LSASEPALSEVSPFFAALALLVAALSLAMLRRWVAVPAVPRRNGTIDGLRGYLALGVVLHHSAIWYFYAQGEKWQLPPSAFYTHLGQSSVALFFMITGFLFYGKVLDAGDQGLDWSRLAVSRVLRLVPLYVCAIGSMLLVVLAMGSFELHDSLFTLAKGVVHWLLFTLTYAPDLNGLTGTGRILAGVYWSLPYEWYFYGCLPLLAGLAGRLPPWWALALSAVVAFQFARFQPESYHLAAFAGGIAAAYTARWAVWQAVAESAKSSVFALGLLLGLVLGFDHAHGLVQVVMLALVFALVAAGCSLWGLLLHPSSRLLGELTYGLYLFHGIALYIVFGTGLLPATTSPLGHWIRVLALLPVLIGVCWLLHWAIERPAMGQVDRMTEWLLRRGESVKPVFNGSRTE